MGYLGSALKSQLNRRGWTAAELSRKTGLQQSWISRIVRGIQTYSSHEDFIKIVGCFERDEHGHRSPQDQAALVAARMMDHKVGPGSELVSVAIKSPSGNNAKPLKTVKHSSEAERAFEFLRLHPSQDKIEPLVIALAISLGMPEEPPT